MQKAFNTTRSRKTAGRRPILVTGCSRSGTTWVGRMLANHKSVRYIFEPFHPRPSLTTSICSKPFNCWFTHICNENAYLFEDFISQAIGMRFSILKEMASIQSADDCVRLMHFFREYVFDLFLGRRPLIKDPNAFFSAEWLHQVYGADIIVMVRHPAAVAASIKRFGWKHPVEMFLEQKHLMNHYLWFMKDDLNASTGRQLSVLESAALLWKAVYGTLLQLQNTYDHWLVIRHEDLLNDPHGCIEQLQISVGLQPSLHVSAAVDETTQKDGPLSSQNVHCVKRDVSRLSKRWLAELSHADINFIKKCTSGIWEEFYVEEDWK